MRRLTRSLASTALLVGATTLTVPAASASPTTLDTLNCLTGTSRTTYNPPIS